LRGTTTSKAVLGTGVAVSFLGRTIGGKLGAGILGFGLAHVVLGALDKFRPSVRY